MFTVIADVAAAFLLVAHGTQPVGRFVLVIAAGVFLYWAGMILNDVFDIEKDKIERPSRPLASGNISLTTASRAGWFFLAFGIALAIISGQIPSAHLATTWMPGLVAGLLALMIVLYDGPLKSTPLAPATMGSCRVLSFLLGASPVVIHDDALFPKYLVAIALGFGTYIMGITTMARREAIGGRSPNLLTGLIVTGVGVAVLAVSPRLYDGVPQWHLSPDRAFPILIGLVGIPVILRGMRLQSDPSPTNIQSTIRAGILSMIPLAAAFALLGAGIIWGLIVFSLVFPAILLSMRLRVT